MKTSLQYVLPAVIAVTILSFIPLLSVRATWIDVLLLCTGLAGAGVITFIILQKTQKLNIQEKFLKDKQNFELLVGSIRDYAIFLLDVNGLVASWNSGAESINGACVKIVLPFTPTLFLLPYMINCTNIMVMQ